MSDGTCSSPPISARAKITCAISPPASPATWTNPSGGRNVLDDLVGKAAIVSEDARTTPTRIDLALFSRSGFTPDLEKEAESRGVLLASVDDVLAT